MPVVPFFKSPLTDLTGFMSTHQLYGDCRDIELKMMNCLEAYGERKGMKTCEDLFGDFIECYSQEKQNKRINEMRKERKRQYNAGEKSLDELYIPPPREDAVR